MGTPRKTKSDKNPNSWRWMKFGDVAKLRQGKYIPSIFLSEQKTTKRQFPVFGGNGIRGYSEFFEYKNSKPIVTCRGSGCGLVQKTKAYSSITNSSIAIEIDKIILNNTFVFYLASSTNFSDVTTGSAQPQITISHLSNKDILIPPLPEQKAIAEVLSSLDDKIDLLHRQNKILEGMAQTLFRQWFVEEADNGHGKKNLECIINISSGKGLKKDEYIKNGKVPVFGANGEIGKTNRFLLDDKIIFTGRVGTLGEIFISHGKAWLSDNTLIIKTAQKYFYFIYFFLKNEKLQRYNKGSTQPLITQSDIKTINFILPTDEKLQKFSSQSHMFFRKISSNQSQINALKNLRDTLLPKLMCGEIRVI